jgi:DNA modification methylase
LTEYNAVYIFNADPMFPSLRAGMKAAGFYYSQMIIWLKNQPVMSRKDYLSMYELIAYGWFGKHKMERSKATQRHLPSPTDKIETPPYAEARRTIAKDHP